MAIPSSGSLSYAQIQTEFGGTNPISLNEYYAGGGLVAPGTTGTFGAVPSSGQISTRNFFGTSAVPPIYVQDVFAANTYTGTGGNVTISNGINLANSGGLVWIKSRSSSYDHQLYDSVRGTTFKLATNNFAAQVNAGSNSPTFNSNGFTDRNNWGSGETMVGWTFRQHPKFFQIISYTGDGNTGDTRPIAHGMGHKPGFVVVKPKSVGSDFTRDSWTVGHIGYEFARYAFLNSTNAWQNLISIPRPVAMDSNYIYVFSTSNQSSTYDYWRMNELGKEYIAYVFATNAGGFGASGNENIISCGNYSGSGSAGSPSINVGFQPQWLLLKRANNINDAGEWYIIDATRGTTKSLSTNSSSSENTFGTAPVTLTSTGFTINTSSTLFNEAVYSYTYVAIRAPM